MSKQKRQSHSFYMRATLGTADKCSMQDNDFPASQEEKAKQEHRILNCLHLSQLIQIQSCIGRYIKCFILICLFLQLYFQLCFFKGTNSLGKCSKDIQNKSLQLHFGLLGEDIIYIDSYLFLISYITVT